MKHILYIHLVCLFALVFVSCSDDDGLNTNGAVISMGKSVYRVKESKGLFTIPVVATGERNGDVRFTIEVKTNNTDCVENKHFIVTSKQIVIPASKSSVNVEIKAIDDRVINADRQFTVTIVSVKGATIDQTLASTDVTLLDNDDIPYDRMGGKWTVTAIDQLSETPETVTWETNLITAVDESEEGYGSVITMSPWRMWTGDTYEGMLDISHSLMFSYNESSQTALLTLKLGETMATDIPLGGENEDGYDLTSCVLKSVTTSQTGYTLTGSINGNVNSDFTKITFSLPLMGLLYDTKGTPYSYWFYYTDIVLTRE